jgi:uncharacterized protein (TIGR02246 family)
MNLTVHQLEMERKMMNITVIDKVVLFLGFALLVGCKPQSENANQLNKDDKANRPVKEKEITKDSNHEPEDWPGLFTKHLNAGDLDAVVDMYEPEARFVTPSGDILVGRDKIRQVLVGLIDAKTQFQSRVVKKVIVGDIALLYSDFQGTTNDPSGKTVKIQSKAIEVLRKQPDGTWKLIVGDPGGRE